MAGAKHPLVFDVDAWVRDTRVLSLEARAIWMDLLTEMHRNGRRGYLTNRPGTPWTPEQIAAFCGCSAATASRVAQELVDSGVASRTDQGVLYSRRMVRDERIRQVRSRAGRKGGAITAGLLKQKSKQNSSKRSSKNEANGEAAPDLFSHAGDACESGEALGAAGVGDVAPPPLPSPPPFSPPTPPSYTPPTSNPSPEEKACARPASNGCFESFWAAYPRKTAKADARKAWAKLKPDDALLGVMLAALARQKESAQWREGIIPHPATWLNGRRWEDEVPVAGMEARNGHAGLGGGMGPTGRIRPEAGKYEARGDDFRAAPGPEPGANGQAPPGPAPHHRPD